MVTAIALVAVTSWTIHSRAGEQRGVPAAQPAAHAGATAPRHRAASTSRATAPSLSPSPSPSAIDGRADTAVPPPPAPEPSGEEQENSTPPVSVGVRSHIWDLRCNHRYLIDRPPREVPPPPVEQDAEGWATAQGAVHGDTTNVEVTVQARSSEPVVFRALRVHVVKRRAPLPWSSFAMNPGCGGSLSPAEYEVDLDAPRPLARPEDGGDDIYGGSYPVARFPYQVTASNPLVLLVRARTAGCDCEWYLELDWTSADRSGRMRIDDTGRPFRTSTTSGRPQYVYGYRSWIRTSS